MGVYAFWDVSLLYVSVFGFAMRYSEILCYLLTLSVNYIFYIFGGLGSIILYTSLWHLSLSLYCTLLIYLYLQNTVSLRARISFCFQLYLKWVHMPGTPEVLYVSIPIFPLSPFSFQLSSGGIRVV